MHHSETLKYYMRSGSMQLAFAVFESLFSDQNKWFSARELDASSTDAGTQWYCITYLYITLEQVHNSQAKLRKFQYNQPQVTSAEKVSKLQKKITFLHYTNPKPFPRKNEVLHIFTLGPGIGFRNFLRLVLVVAQLTISAWEQFWKKESIFSLTSHSEKNQQELMIILIPEGLSFDSWCWRSSSSDWWGSKLKWLFRKQKWNHSYYQNTNRQQGKDWT